MKKVHVIAELLASIAEGAIRSYRSSKLDEQEERYINTDKLRLLIREGRKLEAMKYFRVSTGASMKEAREAIAWLENEQIQRNPCAS